MLAVAGKLNPKPAARASSFPSIKELVNLLYKPSQWAVTPEPASTTAAACT